MTKKLTTSAMLVALSVVLSMVTVFSAPYGGTVTAASMVPVIITGLIYRSKWGLLTALVYAVLQMIIGGIVPPPVPSFWMYLLVILLDYVFAYTCLGLSGYFFELLKKSRFAIPCSGAIVMMIRFVCHFLSGILIWGVYAPEGTSVWVYSLLYNGAYMLPEIVLSTIILCLLIKPIHSIYKKSL